MPVLSWLILRGRCRHCKAAISPRYLIIELLTGALFLACYWYFGWTLSTLKYCAFSFLLLGLIFTDAETKLLPDKLTLTGLGLGLIFSLHCSGERSGGAVSVWRRSTCRSAEISSIG